LKSITSSLQAAGLIAALLLTQIGCTEPGQEPVTDDSALTSPVPDGMVRGTVAETMNSGGYTYVLIETGQDDVWAAAPGLVVQVGDVVQIAQGMAMSDFTSKSLNRTFDLVYFVGAIENLSAPALSTGLPETALPPANPGAENTSEPVRQEIMPQEIKVAELQPGQNIAYVWANKDELAGQPVSLRGKVVKYNANILGTNFIHIQDGSGDVTDGSNDLTVTSKAVTAVGEQVIVTGSIILNKDFGYGYNFPVLMEDASITPE
jgi:hypothetical protein